VVNFALVRKHAESESLVLVSVELAVEGSDAEELNEGGPGAAAFDLAISSMAVVEIFSLTLLIPDSDVKNFDSSFS
jgi:hypothetical protein